MSETGWALRDKGEYEGRKEETCQVEIAHPKACRPKEPMESWEKFRHKHIIIKSLDLDLNFQLNPNSATVNCKIPAFPVNLSVTWGSSLYAVITID